MDRKSRLLWLAFWCLWQLQDKTSEIAKSAEATKVAAETARQQLRATTAPIVNFSVEPTGNAGVQWLEPGISELRSRNG